MGWEAVAEAAKSQPQLLKKPLERGSFAPHPTRPQTLRLPTQKVLAELSTSHATRETLHPSCMSHPTVSIDDCAENLNEQQT